MKPIIKRILVSPFIFIANTLMVYGGLIFPTTMIIMFSLIQLLIYPFQDIVSLATGKKFSRDSWPGHPMIEIYNKYIGAFLGTTVLIWFPFYSTYIFIVHNHIGILGQS